MQETPTELPPPFPDLAPPAAHPVALVTGARSGIGRETALALARAGYKVYAGLRVAGDATDLLGPLPDDLAIMPVVLDVTDPQDRCRVIADIAAVDGRLDVLVNNAGVALDGPLELISDEEFENLFRVNVFGSFGLTREALGLMHIAGQGHVVMVSSMSGRMALPCMGAYASSKFALEGLGEAWRLELEPLGIRLSLIEPGPYRTDLFRPDAISAETRDAIGAQGPYRALITRFLTLREAVKRQAGDPREVADTILRIVQSHSAPLRTPVGLSARVRSLAIRLLPDGALGRLVQSLFRPAPPRTRRTPESAPAGAQPTPRATVTPEARWGLRGRNPRP